MVDEKLDLETGLRRSKLTHHYLGDIEAESRFECLAYAGAAGISIFVGLEYLTGRIGDRKRWFHLAARRFCQIRANNQYAQRHHRIWHWRF